MARAELADRGVGVGDLVNALVVAFLVGVPGLVASASLFLRFRRARGVEHQQIKWLVFTTSVFVLGATLAYIVHGATGARWAWSVGQSLLAVASVGTPIAMGVAILKYRLYEIDTLINRTLVYGSLTVLLAAVYFGGVTATQALLRTFTGQEQLPQLVVVASTLVIALEAVPSSLAGEHRGPVCIVVVSPRVGEPYLSTAA